MLLSTTIGAWFNSTVTIKWQVAELVHASVAEQLTVVLPTGKTAPEAGLQVTVGVDEQVSLAVTVKLTAVPPLFVVTTLMFVEQTIVGGVVSTT